MYFVGTGKAVPHEAQGLQYLLLLHVGRELLRHRRNDPVSVLHCFGSWLENKAND